MLSAAKEKRQHGSMQVPYSYYDCRMPNYFPGVPLHFLHPSIRFSAASRKSISYPAFYSAISGSSSPPWARSTSSSVR